MCDWALTTVCACCLCFCDCVFADVHFPQRAFSKFSSAQLFLLREYIGRVCCISGLFVVLADVHLVKFVTNSDGWSVDLFAFCVADCPQMKFSQQRLL